MLNSHSFSSHDRSKSVGFDGKIKVIQLSIWGWVIWWIRDPFISNNKIACSTSVAHYHNEISEVPSHLIGPFQNVDQSQSFVSAFVYFLDLLNADWLMACFCFLKTQWMDDAYMLILAFLAFLWPLLFMVWSCKHRWSSARLRLALHSSSALSSNKELLYKRVNRQKFLAQFPSCTCPVMNSILVFLVAVLTLEATKTSASTLRRMPVPEQNDIFDEDYDDFSEVPQQFLRHAYNIPHSAVSDQKLVDFLLPTPRKRYRKLTKQCIQIPIRVQKLNK